MDELNIIIERRHNGLALSEGTPHELGIHAAKYIEFRYCNIRVSVWTADELRREEIPPLNRRLLHATKKFSQVGEMKLND